MVQARSRNPDKSPIIETLHHRVLLQSLLTVYSVLRSQEWY